MGQSDTKRVFIDGVWNPNKNCESVLNKSTVDGVTIPGAVFEPLPKSLEYINHGKKVRPIIDPDSINPPRDFRGKSSMCKKKKTAWQNKNNPKK